MHCLICNLAIAPGDPDTVTKDGVRSHGPCYRSIKAQASEANLQPSFSPVDVLRIQQEARRATLRRAFVRGEVI